MAECKHVQCPPIGEHRFDREARTLADRVHSLLHFLFLKKNDIFLQSSPAGITHSLIKHVIHWESSERHCCVVFYKSRQGRQGATQST
jgi:hypothetical protein